MRQEAGEAPQPESYRDRFPHLAQRLARLFELEQLLDSKWITADTISGTRLDDFDTPVFDGTQPVVPARTLARIGDYDCTKIIGQGGMGMVYEAVPSAIEATVGSQGRVADEPCR